MTAEAQSEYEETSPAESGRILDYFFFKDLLLPDFLHKI